MFTSTNPSPHPSPRLGGERELFPFGACVKMYPTVLLPLRAGLTNDSPFWEKPVRAGIFVAWQFKNKQSSIGATSSEYATPTALVSR
jgi:hypothetical protein